MNREDIIRMEREAGFELNMWQLSVGCEATGTHEELERFAALVAAERDRFWQAHIEPQIEIEVAAEREECAKVCETHAATTTPTWVSYAAAIRARGRV
jgi:hypothetical protein